MKLFIFGEQNPEFPSYEHKEYTCLGSHSSINPDHQQRLLDTAERHRKQGHDVFVHDGECVGRDGYPVTPSPELADALRKAGWVKCYAQSPDEKQRAEKAGVPY